MLNAMGNFKNFARVSREALKFSGITFFVFVQISIKKIFVDAAMSDGHSHLNYTTFVPGVQIDCCFPWHVSCAQTALFYQYDIIYLFLGGDRKNVPVCISQFGTLKFATFDTGVQKL